jgi:hypothetical protein
MLMFRHVRRLFLGVNDPFAAHRFDKQSNPERSCSQDQSGDAAKMKAAGRVILFVKRLATSTARSSALTQTTRAQELP